MKEATLTVAYVNPPKQGKKNGTIKGTDESFYLVKPDKLSSFHPGGMYKVGYEEFTIGGNLFKEIKSVEQTGTAPTTQAAPKQAVQHDDRTAERIFVCGAFNHTMSNANVNPLELTKEAKLRLINELQWLWANTLGKKPMSVAKSEGAENDMDDQIPY